MTVNLKHVQYVSGHAYNHYTSKITLESLTKIKINIDVQLETMSLIMKDI